MNQKTSAAALLFVVFSFAATPVLTGFSADALAQGYAGVMASEGQGTAGDDQGAMPYMSSSGGADARPRLDHPVGAQPMVSQGLSEHNSEEDMAAGDEGAEKEPPDITDVYGLKNNSNQDQSQESNAQQGFLAAFSDGKPRDELDPLSDPVPDNMYRAMEGRDEDPAEQNRKRVQRSVQASEARRLREIEEMNATRMRGHQEQAQGELDRIMVMQDETMNKIREKQGLPPLEKEEGEYAEESADSVGGEENAEGNADSSGGGSGGDSSNAGGVE